MLWPTKKTIIGARATIGIVWLATTYGRNARSTSEKWTKAVAIAMPSTPPTTKPMKASRHV